MQVMEANPQDPALTAALPLPSRSCPRCDTPFAPGRRNQAYCGRECQQAFTRNAARGPRTIENRSRSLAHYERAAWLCFDAARLFPTPRRRMVLALLEAASGPDAGLRNILLDPALLGADRRSPIGKLYPDTRAADAPNIAKLADAFCRAEWGVGIRDAVLDAGRPAWRSFAEMDGHTEPQDAPEGEPEVHLRRDPTAFLTWLRTERRARALGTDNPPSAL